jgi:hypothetical protein
VSGRHAKIHSRKFLDNWASDACFASCVVQLTEATIDSHAGRDEKRQSKACSVWEVGVAGCDSKEGRLSPQFQRNPDTIKQVYMLLGVNDYSARRLPSPRPQFVAKDGNLAQLLKVSWKMVLTERFMIYHGS